MDGIGSNVPNYGKGSRPTAGGDGVPVLPATLSHEGAVDKTKLPADAIVKALLSTEFSGHPEQALVLIYLAAGSALPPLK